MCTTVRFFLVWNFSERVYADPCLQWSLGNLYGQLVPVRVVHGTWCFSKILQISSETNRLWPFGRICTLNTATGTIYFSCTIYTYIYIYSNTALVVQGGVRTVSKFLSNSEPISRSVESRMQQWHSPKIVEAKLPQRWRCVTWLWWCWVSTSKCQGQDFWWIKMRFVGFNPFWRLKNPLLGNIGKHADNQNADLGLITLFCYIFRHQNWWFE